MEPKFDFIILITIFEVFSYFVTFKLSCTLPELFPLLNEKFSSFFKQLIIWKTKFVSRCIGEGGYSRVYEVFNDQNEIQALKVVNLKETKIEEDLRKEIDFLCELKTCLKVVDIFEHELKSTKGKIIVDILQSRCLGKIYYDFNLFSENTESMKLLQNYIYQKMELLSRWKDKTFQKVPAPSGKSHWN